MVRLKAPCGVLDLYKTHKNEARSGKIKRSSVLQLRV